MTTIVALADTHGRHNRYHDLPDGDILVFAGDACTTGRISEWRDFVNWLASQPHPEKVVIAGNHDCLLEPGDHRREEALQYLRERTDAHYLQDSGVKIDGLQFWGSPWTPKLDRWVFQRDREELKEVWEQVPWNTDVLVTHGPARGFGDYLEGHGHIGDEALRYTWLVLQNARRTTHIYGHVHEHNGEQVHGSYNVSVLDENYAPVDDPQKIEVGL